MARLDTWYTCWPNEARLAALFSRETSPLSASQERGLLFVHVLFLGTIILLHYRPLACMLASQFDHRISHGLSDEFAGYTDRPAIAARQIARIFQLVDEEKNVFRRCWLCM